MSVESAAPTAARPFWLAGRPAYGEATSSTVPRVPTGGWWRRVSVPTAAQVEEAVCRSGGVSREAAALTLGQRADALAHMSRRGCSSARRRSLA